MLTKLRTADLAFEGAPAAHRGRADTAARVRALAVQALSASATARRRGGQERAAAWMVKADGEGAPLEAASASS